MLSNLQGVRTPRFQARGMWMLWALQNRQYFGTRIVHKNFLGLRKYPPEDSIPFALAAASLSNPLIAHLVSRVTRRASWLKDCLGEPGEGDLASQVRPGSVSGAASLGATLHTWVVVPGPNFWTLF